MDSFPDINNPDIGGQNQVRLPERMAGVAVAESGRRNGSREIVTAAPALFTT
jgi:hypothetical protein